MGIISKVLNLPTEIEPRSFQQPVFVVGCMRSGTSLLLNTLDEHPQLLKVGFELNDIWSAIGGAKCTDKCEHKTANDLDLTFAHNMTNYFSESIREAKTVTRHLQRVKNRWDQGSGGVFYDWENIIPVNKSPHLMNKIGYASAMYPNAKFVFIVRSIYGQSSSMKMHFERYLSKKGVVGFLPNNERDCWSIIPKEEAPEMHKNRCYPGDNFSLMPEAWMRLNKVALSELQKLDDDRYIIISYENLVLEQYNVLKRVFDFLDLDERHREKEEKLFNRSRKLMNNHTGNPLINWKQHLSKEQIETIYQVIEDNQGDYTRIQKSLIPSAREKWNTDVNLSLKIVA